jgi:ppGpp synthetase/RelA/SpoT-type nucleotidyltranferase
MIDIENELISDFNSIKEHLELWGRLIDGILLEELTKHPEFNLINLEISPTFRLKDDTKLIQKAFYRGKKYKNPIDDITDKVGTRIVVTTRKDISIVSDIVRLCENNGNWIISENKDVESFILVDPTKFSYQAEHFILSPGIRNQDEFNEIPLSRITCELQIKSLLQHSWAQVTHDTIYKGCFKDDSNLARTMAKCMALIEATDDYYDDAFVYMDNEEDKVIENKLINEIISYSLESFGINFELSKTDFRMVKSFFDSFNKELFDFNDVKHKLLTRRDDVVNLLSSTRVYLSKQPISILIAYLLITRRSQLLKEKWPFDENSLRIAFSLMNHSYDKE